MVPVATFVQAVADTAMEDPSAVLPATSIALAVMLGGVLLLWAKHLYSLHSCRASVPGAVLPKGSYGWPLIGESLAFTSDPKRFSHSHVKRFGNVFKSFLFLRRSIVGTTPEFAKFVLTNGNVFKRSWPDHIADFVGRNTFMLQEGPKHMAVRKVLLKALGPDSLRAQVEPLEALILESMASWARSGTVNGLNAMQELTWDTSNWLLFGDKRSRSTPEGRENFKSFRMIVRTLSSIPLNLPGTTYSKGWKGREALIAHFQKLLQQTKGKKTVDGAVMRALMASWDDPEGKEELKHLDDYTMAENFYLLNIATYDTTSTTLVWVLKFLVDNPEVFRRIQAEHQEILKSKDPSVEGPRLTWEDTRKMVYTNKFFQEMQRYLSVSPATFTEATEDVKFGDHLIPKGWIVVTMSNFIHSDPANYPDLSFNPDRFDVTPKPYTFIPFSSGPHMCPGIELAKLISFIFIHHLTTTYTYERVGPDKGMEYEGIFPRPKGGYPFTMQPII